MTRRVLLKLSGEALMGSQDFGVDDAMLTRVAHEIQQAHATGVQIGIVVGGGNLFRGVQGTAKGMNRTKADNVGMMATIMNSLILSDALERAGCGCKAFCTIEMPRVLDLFTARDAEHALQQGLVCIFAGGTGSPFFTTDTAAALKAAEIGASEVLKATQVDGIYEADPRKNPTAKRYTQLSFQHCLTHNLKVMDQAAFSLCQTENITLHVFDLHQDGYLNQALQGQTLGTLVGTGLEVRFH
jgi:uridylate kinase